MGNNKLLKTTSDDVVPTNTLAAAFAIAFAMGLVVVTGILFKPYEAKEVVEELHQRILYEREMRELRRMSYGADLVNSSYTVVASMSGEGNYYPNSSYFRATPVAKSESKKTERAETFDREVRSDDYWASLHSSVRDGGIPAPSSEPVVIPPVIIGSAE